MDSSNKLRSTFPEEARAFFEAAGREGGKKRARLHSAEELSEWGKMGGRPGKQDRSKAKRGEAGRKRKKGGA